MKIYFLGDAIKRKRLELGLTQERLCEGICEPITLSRLENGKQTPSRTRLHALMERLDMPEDQYYALLSKHELEVEALQREITSLNLRFTQAKGEEKRELRAQALQKSAGRNRRRRRQNKPPVDFAFQSNSGKRGWAVHSRREENHSSGSHSLNLPIL